jgi:meiosis-specific transcription factor NDT80
MYGAASNLPTSMMVDYNPQHYGSTQHQGPPQSHTFERIQFQKATANNGKRRAQQQYFHVVVELFADVGRHGDPQWIKIATSQSHPMVVRGRSPGHYKDNRRDSATSMDPDRGAGAGGDGPGGAPSLGSYLGPSHGRPSTMDWESTHRGSSQLGGSYRHATEDYSPDSVTSLESSSSSCGELEFDFLRTEETMSTSNLISPSLTGPGSVNQKALTSLLGLRPQASPGTSHAQGGSGGPIRFNTNAGAELESLRSAIHCSNRTGRMELPLHRALCTS